MKSIVTISLMSMLLFACTKSNDVVDYPPTAPSNLSATENAQGRIDLTWNDNSNNELGFIIEKKTGSGNYIDIDTVSFNITSFQDTAGVTRGTFVYRVAAYFNNTRSGSIPDTVVIACREANVVLSDLTGDYDNTNETLGTSAYGPYTTTISSAVATGPTTGTIVVENIWDNGWGPITFNLDWTDPNNRTATVVDQAAIPGSDAGDLNPANAGTTISVRVPPSALSATPGTFSTCGQTFQLKMQLGVTGGSYVNALYTVNLER